jgi:hypothetical protein
MTTVELVLNRTSRPQAPPPSSSTPHGGGCASPWWSTLKASPHSSTYSADAKFARPRPRLPCRRLHRPPQVLRITARRSGLDPAKWLEDVLRRIPTATTANLHELLPGNWKPATA